MRSWRGAAAVVALVLLSACGGDEPTMTGLPYSDYAHEDEPFARELFAEQANLPGTPDDEIGVVPRDYDAEHTHVRDLARRTLDTPGTGPVVWFFGGSTLFGVGQRDDHTIPSEIVRLADAAGTPIEALTFGFPSYASWQEVALMRRALADRGAPDLVVFYHGANDHAVVCRQLALGLEPDGRAISLMAEEPEEPEIACVDDPGMTGRLVADAVSRSMAEARTALGPIPVMEFWQPTAATRRPDDADGPLLERLAVSQSGRDELAAGYLDALGRMEPAPVDLTDALDDHDGPTFFDWAHTNEAGARVVAEAMWERGLADAVARLG